jgi:hypothetical protein
MLNPSVGMKNYLLHYVENYLKIEIKMDVDWMHQFLTKPMIPKILLVDLMMSKINHYMKMKIDVVVVSSEDNQNEVLDI